MFQSLLFFLPESPMLILFVVAVGFLLFGSSKLPQLAKSIGQSKKAFNEGLREAEEEEKKAAALKNTATAPNLNAPSVSAVTDEELMAELRRRAAEKQTLN